MKKSFRLVAIMLALLMTGSLCACSGTSTVSDTETSDADTVPETEPDPIPVVSDESIGVANVAHTGFAMAGSSKYTEGKYANLYVNDRDSTTGFSTDTFEEKDNETYLFIDLTRTWDIQKVIICPKKGEERLFPKNFDVQVSQDGKEWTTIETLSDVSSVTSSGVSVDVNKSASFVRLLMHEMTKDRDGYRCVIGEFQVLAAVTRRDDIVLKQNDMWLYMDTDNASLVIDHRLIEGNEGTGTLSFYTDDPNIATVDSQGKITPTGYGDTTLYVYDGNDLASCHVRVIDDTKTEFRISTFYHSTFGHPEVIPECLDYMKEAGITFLEETRAFDSVGNVVCDYMMYLCAKRDIFYSVCDLINDDAITKLSDDEIIALVQKYENRAGLGGIYLRDEPHEQSNDYAHVVHVVNEYNPHLTAHLNMLPGGGFPSWEEYLSDYCSVAGNAGGWRYLSYDNYCFKADGGFSWSVYRTLNGIRKQGLKYNAKTGYYMQCVEIAGSLRASSDTDLLLNASMGLAYGMKNFKTFVYLTPINADGDYRNGVMGPDFKPSSMYEGLKAANAKITEWGHVLGKSDAIEVYHSTQVDGNEIVPDDFVLRQKTKYESIYSLYRSNEDGQQYVVVVNRTYTAGEDKDFKFATASDLKSLELYENGTWKTVDIQNGEFTLHINAGDSAILRLPAGYDARRPAEKSDNLALNCGVYSSSSKYTFWEDTEIGAMYLTDGNTASGGWIATESGSSHTLTVDLGEKKKVSDVTLYTFVTHEDSMPKKVSIDISDDGIKWTQAYADTDIAVSDGKTTCAFNSVEARYVRLNLTSEPGKCAIGEFEVHS